LLIESCSSKSSDESYSYPGTSISWSNNFHSNKKITDLIQHAL
jgi:hypothetical protein